MDLSTIPAPMWVIIGAAVTGLVTIVTSGIQGHFAARTAETTALGQIEAVRAEALAVREREAAAARRQREFDRLDDVLKLASSVVQTLTELAEVIERKTILMTGEQFKQSLRQMESELALLRLRAPDMRTPDPNMVVPSLRQSLRTGEAFMGQTDPRLVKYQDDFELAVAEYVRSAALAVMTDSGTSPNAYPTETPEQGQTVRHD